MSFLQTIGVKLYTMSEAEEAAKKFYKAMKGLGTDESAIVKEICSHSNGQLQMIKEKYMTLYGHKLEDDIKSEIRGYFLEGVLGLLMPKDEFEAKCIRDAIKGLGTNEKVVIQTLCPKEAHEIEVLKEAYKRVYNQDLEKDISDEQGGPLGRIFRSLVSAGRPANYGVDEGLARAEADELYKAGKGKLGTDECKFVQILCSRSFQQLNATFAAYAQQRKHDIEKAIKDEMSGDLERACLAIVKAVKSKPAYFAEQLHEAMAGLGTKDKDLIRLLVSRHEVDLGAVKQQYKAKYGKSLYDAVKSELSGDYEKLFLTLIGKD